MHQVPAKYLILIESGGAAEALMYTADRKLVAGFDASTEEVAVMTSGLEPGYGIGSKREWDEALSGHSAAEREAAVVYKLDV